MKAFHDTPWLAPPASIGARLSLAWFIGIFRCRHGAFHVSDPLDVDRCSAHKRCWGERPHSGLGPTTVPIAYMRPMQRAIIRATLSKRAVMEAAVVAFCPQGKYVDKLTSSPPKVVPFAYWISPPPPPLLAGQPEPPPAPEVKVCQAPEMSSAAAAAIFRQHALALFGWRSIRC